MVLNNIIIVVETVSILQHDLTNTTLINMIYTNAYELII